MQRAHKSLVDIFLKHVLETGDFGLESILLVFTSTAGVSGVTTASGDTVRLRMWRSTGSRTLIIAKSGVVTFDGQFYVHDFLLMWLGR